MPCLSAILLFHPLQKLKWAAMTAILCTILDFAFSQKSSGSIEPLEPPLTRPLSGIKARVGCCVTLNSDFFEALLNTVENGMFIQKYGYIITLTYIL